MRLIDADSLKVISLVWPDDVDRDSYLQGYKDALERMDAQPTIDAVPVAHGRWATLGSKRKSWLFYCSECGGHAYWPQANNVKKAVQRKCGYEKCPHCGAKMDGERREDDDKA